MIKYSPLFCLITTIIACKEHHKESTSKDKVKTIKVASKRTRPAIYFEKEIVENLEAADEKIALSAAYILYQSLYKGNELDALTFSEFQGAYQFTCVKKVSDKQQLVVLGMEYDDNQFESFLLNKKESLGWELKAVERTDTRFVIQASDVEYDSTNNLLHFVVEQTWSSHGGLAFELFYRITTDSMRQVLHRNASGGHEVDIAVRSQEGCNMDIVVNFYSDLDTISKNELQFLYNYEILLYSNCDGAIKFRDTILKEIDRITYTYNAKKGLYVPNWNSLKILNQDKFEAITSWGDLDPFELEIEDYCHKIENRMPRSAELLRFSF